MYDVSKLKTIAECRTVMQRARKANREVYIAALKRSCVIAGAAHDDPNDPIVLEFHQMLAAYEQLLTEKNGKNTAASRTRQKLANKGVRQSLIEWARGKTETNGFKALVDAGLPEMTGEYIILRHKDQFPSDVIDLARERLASHGIDVLSAA